jgi:hypothetical protein
MGRDFSIADISASLAGSASKEARCGSTGAWCAGCVSCRQLNFVLSRTSLDLCGRGAAHFVGAVNRGDKQEISGACLDCTRAGEKEIRKSISDRAKAKFIPRIPFREKVDYIRHSSAAVFRKIDP